MPWSHRSYGSATDPIRQSDLNDTASPHGCSRRFWYRKTEEAEGTRELPDRARWQLCNGSAVHAMIERALAPAAWAKLREHGDRALGSKALYERLEQLYDEELARAAEGRPIDWGRESNPANVKWQACVMVRELLRDLLERIERPLAVEAPFAAELDGYHMIGTVDLVYEPKHRPGEVAFCDWKTGQQRVHPNVLAHGYQTAIYAHAVEHGVFFPGTERELRFGRFPCAIHIVHLREYLPYSKRTTFTLERLEEVEFFSRLADRALERGQLVEVVPSSAPPPKLKKDGTPYKERTRKRHVAAVIKSDRRGPAWYAAPRTPADVARLRVSLGSIVGTVRLGRFYESIGDQCDRCAFRMQCLNAGHELEPSEQRVLNRALAGVEGLDALTDYAV